MSQPNNRSITSTFGATGGSSTRPSTRPAANSRRATSSSEVLDIPPFVKRALNKEEQEILDKGIKPIPQPVVKLSKFTDGLTAQSDDDSNSTGQEGDPGLQYATQIKFEANFEFGQEFLEFSEAFETIIELDAPLNPYKAVLFHGQTGTGKTTAILQMIDSFRRTVTDRQIEYLTTDYGKIQSSLVGQAEKNITAMKQQLNGLDPEKYYILHIDEIDSFFSDRGSSAQHRIDFTNEMIKFMDSLPSNVTLIGTTNLVDSIDSANLRRFTEIIEFKDPSDDYKAKTLLAMQETYGITDNYMLEDIGSYKIYHLQKQVNQEYKQLLRSKNNKTVMDLRKNMKAQKRERAKNAEAARKEALELKLKTMNAPAEEWWEAIKSMQSRGQNIQGKTRDHVALINDLRAMSKQTSSTKAYIASNGATTQAVDETEIVKHMFIKDTPTTVEETIIAINTKTGREADDCKLGYMITAKIMGTPLINENGTKVLPVAVTTYENAEAYLEEDELITSMLGIRYTGEEPTVEQLTENMERVVGFKVTFGCASLTEYLAQQAAAEQTNKAAEEKGEEVSTTKVDPAIDRLVKFARSKDLAMEIDGHMYVKEELAFIMAAQEQEKYQAAPEVMKPNKVDSLGKISVSNKKITADRLIKEKTTVAEGTMMRSVKYKYMTPYSFMIETVQKVGIGGNPGYALEPSEWMNKLKGKDWVVLPASITDKAHLANFVEAEYKIKLD